MKEILHLKNVLYTKKHGFIFQTKPKNVDLYVNNYIIDASIVYTETIEQPIIVCDMIHSTFCHGLIDSIFSTYWIKQDIMEEDETKKNFKLFVRKENIEKYPEKNLKNINESNLNFKGVYGELIKVVTKSPLCFEHLVKENRNILIKDCYFSRLDQRWQRSPWNSDTYYPGRSKEKVLFTKRSIQRRLNLFLEELEKENEIVEELNVGEVSNKKRLVIVDRKTDYRSLKKTWLHSEEEKIDMENPNHKTILDNVEHILKNQNKFDFVGTIYLEDLNLKEQIQTFKNNDIIITPQGANMIHSLWSKDKIICEVVFVESHKCLYKRILSFTTNKHIQISPYNLDRFVNYLIQNLV